MSRSLATRARAKINLSLHVVGRRADGYHELESLVAFAAEGDELSLVPGDGLHLTVEGVPADAIGDAADNLVYRAAEALSRRRGGLVTGHFHLLKKLPVASGIGGGSSDAAATLRLLALANGIAPDAPVLYEVAARLGADVPVCIDQATRIMRGTGTDLAPPIAIDPIPALLVNPGIPVETARVFSALGLAPGEQSATASQQDLGATLHSSDIVAFAKSQRNDLMSPAMRVAPVIGEVLHAVGKSPGCLLARMSGSGATVFGLFGSQAQARAAADEIRSAHSGWWVRATTIGG